MSELCNKCGNSPKFLDYRFCRRCKDLVEEEMRKSGYLTKTQQFNIRRHTGAKENKQETKRGLKQ